MTSIFKQVSCFRSALLCSLLVLALLFIDIGLFAGNAGARGRSSEPFEPLEKSTIVWPLPPDPARIAYVRTLQRSTDIKPTKGFFRKVVKLLLGEKINRIVKPYGVVVDSTGRVIVVDSAVKRVHIFDIENEKYKAISSGRKFHFVAPIGVAVDLSDNIYVSDSGSDKVLVFNSL